MKRAFALRLRCLIDRNRSIRRFARAEAGNITVETVLWIPIYVVFLVLIAEASMMFYNRSQALQVVQDANRALAIGRLTSTADAEAFILDRLGAVSPRATAETTIQNGIIRSVAQMPAGDLTSTGVLSMFSELTITTTAQHLSEQ